MSNHPVKNLHHLTLDHQNTSFHLSEKPDDNTITVTGCFGLLHIGTFRLLDSGLEAITRALSRGDKIKIDTCTNQSGNDMVFIVHPASSPRRK